MKTLTQLNEDFKISSKIKTPKNEKPFVYRTEDNTQLMIFDPNWKQFDYYRDKVYIEGKKVELDSSGRTVNVMTAGYYNVNIKDIDKITDCKYMFWYNDHLESVPYFNTCKVTNMENMFSNCRNLNSVEMLDTSRVNNMYNMFYGSDYLNHETIKRWSTVYDFENNKMKEK